MSLGLPRLSSFSVKLSLSVAAVVFAVLTINWLSFRTIYELEKTAMAERSADLDAVSRAVGFNSELSKIQHDVFLLLEQASAGAIGQLEAYRIHADVLDKIFVLEQRLSDLAAAGDELEAVRLFFADYRSATLTATDFAVVNPPAAMQFALQAANQYARLSERTHGIAEAVTLNARRQGETNSTEVRQFAFRTIWVGTALIALCVALWLLGAWILSKRLRVLTKALGHVMQSDADPAILRAVRAIDSGRDGPINHIARAISVLSEVMFERRAAEEKLKERMKELACLYAISRLTERDDLSLPSMLGKL